MRTTPARSCLAIVISVAACADTGDEPEVRLDLHWSLSRAGQLVTCADVDAVSADWLLEGEDDRDFTFTFDCADGLSSGALVPEQAYSISAKLRRADGVVISQCVARYDPAERVGVPPCDFEVP